MKTYGDAIWQRMRTPTSAVLAVLALSACSSNAETPVDNKPPTVGGELVGPVEVHTKAGQTIALEAGTIVTAICVSGQPFEIRSEIKSGQYKGTTVEDIPRGSLEATTDPFHADDQNPPQDRFGGLPICDNE